MSRGRAGRVYMRDLRAGVRAGLSAPPSLITPTTTKGDRRGPRAVSSSRCRMMSPGTLERVSRRRGGSAAAGDPGVGIESGDRTRTPQAAADLTGAGFELIGAS